MLKLNNVKVILFDFDDTLCIHKHHHSHTEEQSREYNSSMLKKGVDTYDKCAPNKHFKQFMSECKQLGIRMGLISLVPSFVHGQVKHDWVLREYGIDLENYCVGTFESKLGIMIAISDAYGIVRESILLVDDYFKNNERAADNGFQVCTPMEVVNYIEDKNNKH